MLYEQAYDGVYQGHAPNYMVVGTAAEGLHNQVLPTRITGVREGMLLGEAL